MHFKLVALLPAINYGTFPVSIKEAMNMLSLPGGYTLPPAESLNKQEKQNKGLLKSWINN
jgi:dihydrodipicolinate synthase/N-acetylneuraminate lyase